ncbi:NAD-dependent epimerase/dehydratase family protein [Candidatus Korobacter versatilis]|nr:NAD-dependent epimerase/dehydratase family protein [Candidatus Koribacter versatilis]
MNKGSFRSALILGGAGFIGSNLASWLLQNTSAKVHIFDNLSRFGVRNNLDWLQGMAATSGRLQITVGDVRDAAHVERVVRHATEIYHFAAQVAVTTSISDPRHDFEVNLGGTVNVLEAARKSDNQPFIFFTSTNKVYGDFGAEDLYLDGKRYRSKNAAGTSETQPLDFHSPYGCSKGAADQYVRDYARIYGLNTVVFRMSCIAGQQQFGNEDQGWVAHFLYSALRGAPITIYGNGKQVRDVLCVDDLVRAIDLARQLPASSEGRIYNIGGGAENALSLLELMDLVKSVTGHGCDVTYDAARPGDQLYYVTDFAKFKRDSGWQPEISPEGTLKKIYDFYKKNRDLFALTAARPSILPAASASELAQPA